MNDGRQKIIRNEKSFWWILLGLFTLSVLMQDSYMFWIALIGSSFFYYFFKSGVMNLYVDEFYLAKRKMIELLTIALGLGVMFSWVVFYEDLKSDNDYTLGISINGMVLLIFCIFAIKTSSAFKVKKKSEDFNNLKQERMYDDIIPELNDSFDYRVVKDENGKKVIDLKDVDIRVITDDRIIRKDLLIEIENVINMEENMIDYLPYSLTYLESEEAIDDFIHELTIPILSNNEQNKFARYLFQLLSDLVKSYKKRYEIKEKIIYFQGIFEYALIDMYLFVLEFKNIPPGNMLAWVDHRIEGNMYSRHLFGCMKSIHSSLNIDTRSVGRFGIGFYAGYYMFLNGKRLDLREKHKEEMELSELFDGYDKDGDIYEQPVEVMKKYL